MIARPSQRLARTAPWALRVAALSAPLVILAVLLHRYGLIEIAPLFLSIALGWALAAVALVLAGVALRSIWLSGHEGWRPAVLAVAIALAVLALPAAIVAEMIRLPRLSDISTDNTDPPLFTVAPESVTMRPLPDEYDRAEQARDYPDIVPRHYPLSPERVFQSVDALVTARGWQVTDRRAPDTDNEVGWIEAEATTIALALPTDVVIRIVADDQGALVDMRSASRIGAHDLGDNARRIRDFFAGLDAALQGVTESDGGLADVDAPDPEAGDTASLPPLPVPPPVSQR